MSLIARPAYSRAPASASSINTQSDIQATGPAFASSTGQDISLGDHELDKSDPFHTPIESGVPSRISSHANLQKAQQAHGYFKSRRVAKGSVQQTLTVIKDPREKWVTIIPLLAMLAGLALSALLVWDGLKTVVNHKYCSVLDDSFASGLDLGVWTKEAEVGGYGNGQFEQTTSTNENVFVLDGALHIKPSLQDASLVESDNVLDLRKDNICTSDVWSNCLTSTNTTNGTIVPPVKSGRINTSRSKSIKYGRVEVTAKLPKGDWLWPAIWMLPTNATYGPWPQSGEIDILESRGNNHTFRQGGNNIMSSALHWGPNSANDAWWRTNNKRQALHTTFADTFHIFGVEWSEKYIFTYINSRLLQVMYVNFDPDTKLWDRGKFPSYDKTNGTQLVSPWDKAGETTPPSRPFDQDFCLILNVAVGGTNGWFEDGQGNKPWVDSSRNARKDFWDAREKWLPTWQDGGEMVVKRVQMWQQKGYNGC
jgi:beta-glucanase (GH16 family)